MRRFVLLLVALLSAGTVRADSTVEIHFSPVENLEKIDIGLISRATTTIDMAAYVLSDWAVIDALGAAEQRGVAVRILLDASQHHAYEKLTNLADNIRVKRSNVFMHLKSYAIDGELLRAGAANLSASGLKHQDNELLIIKDPTAVQAFSARFEAMWTNAKPIYEHDRAVSGMEPK